MKLRDEEVLLLLKPRTYKLCRFGCEESPNNENAALKENAFELSFMRTFLLKILFPWRSIAHVTCNRFIDRKYFLLFVVAELNCSEFLFFIKQ